MRNWLVVVSILFVVPLCSAAADSRGVNLAPLHAEGIEAFDPKDSVALFVGVRHFTHDATLAKVRLGVDNAIDFASVLALDERTRLIDPSHVLLALCGECR